jgi:glycosyltransferase involved in cell wall biosynthesis
MSHADLPLISIVTPSLNQGRFLADCLKSVLSQDYPKLEHFVIDGGSSDETGTVLEAYRQHLTGIVQEPDDGAADAINKGLKLCRGEIVAWLNADDFLLPGALHAVAAAWRRDPGASFYFGNGLRVDIDGQTMGTFNPQPPLFNRRALDQGIDYILQPSTFINARALARINTGALARINTGTLARAGLLDTGLRWSFDWDLWLRLADVAPPVALDAVLSASREYPATLTASGGFVRAEELRRIGARYSGREMTPGGLCYYLDTLHREAERQSPTMDELTPAIQELWLRTARLLRRMGTDASGFPITSGDHDSDLEPLPPARTETLTVAIDLFPLVPGASGGIVPWLNGVLRAYARLFSLDRVILFHRHGEPPITLEAPQALFVPLPAEAVSYHHALASHLRVARPDVLLRAYPQELAPEHLAEVPGFPDERQVFVIPDLQHDFLPELFPKAILTARRRAFHAALSRAGGIATLTGHSQATLQASAWNNCPDIFLMPAALPEELAAETPDEMSRDEALGPAAMWRHYLFMPANLWPHKNHRGLFEALRLALPRLPEGTGLVLTGHVDNWEAAVNGYHDLPICHLGYVGHDRMRAIFRHADALAYFSLFEGFGMPLLEAFHYGVPVVCSNVTSLPEVGGDAVLSCDPTDHAAMAELLVRVMTDEPLRAGLVTRGRARLAAYGWDHAAQELRAGLGRVRDRAGQPRPEPAPPLVSIVMPTRNQGQFIAASIDSVLAQTYPHIELVVMDGVSTDNTVEILKSYGDRITWVSEPDSGQTNAINKGMTRVGGSILAYLNSDDILLPDAVERVVAYFQQHPDWDMLYGNADYIDAVGGFIGPYNTAPYSFARLMDDCCVCQPAAFWRRRIADLVGPFNEALQTAMDYEYWLRLGNAGASIHFVPDKLAQSRLHEDTKTLTMREKIYAEIFDLCLEQGGYISYSFILGLWHHRLCEKNRWTRRFPRLATRLYKLMAVRSYVRLQKRLGRPEEGRRFVRSVVRGAVARRLPWLARLVARLG